MADLRDVFRVRHGTVRSVPADSRLQVRSCPKSGLKDDERDIGKSGVWIDITRHGGEFDEGL